MSTVLALTTWVCQFPDRHEPCTADQPHAPGCDYRRIPDAFPSGVVIGSDGTYFAKGRRAVEIGWEWVPLQGLGWQRGPGTRPQAWYEVRPPIVTHRTPRDGEEAVQALRAGVLERDMTNIPGGPGGWHPCTLIEDHVRQNLGRFRVPADWKPTPDERLADATR